MAKKKSASSIALVISDDKTPRVALTAGMKLDVRMVTLKGGKLGGRPGKLGGRLCGGTTTCLALIDLATPVSNPG